MKSSCVRGLGCLGKEVTAARAAGNLEEGTDSEKGYYKESKFQRASVQTLG